MRQKTAPTFKRSTDLLSSEDKNLPKRTLWKESMTSSALLFDRQNKKVPMARSMRMLI